jgi:hypothetical protein
MSKRILVITLGATLVCASKGSILAKNNLFPSITPAEIAVAQDQASAWTVIEYPVDKEVVVDLLPTSSAPDAKGAAKVTRGNDETSIQVEVSGLSGDASSYNLYAVDHAGKVTLLGSVIVSDGAGALSARTSLSKFMLVLSPEAGLTAIGADTPVALRSAVPSGFEVVALASGSEAEYTAAAERPQTETPPEEPKSYDSPMLRVSELKRGAETLVRVAFTGEAQGLRANASLKPQKGGTTQIKVRFINLKQSPSGTRYVLWSVSSDNAYERVGKVVTAPKSARAKIDAKMSLPDFGLFLTAESEDSPSSPAGALIAKLVR